MTSTPYPISGTVKDADSVALNNVIVSIINIDTNEELTVTTNALGEYVVDLANLTSGYTIGDIISIYASYGRYYDEEFHTTTTDLSGSVNLILSTQMVSSAIYCSILDVRNFTNVQSGEYSNSQIYMMIQMATAKIDNETGRTWKGIQTVTDEAYNGNDMDILDLNNTDIQSITSVKIDDNNDGIYTTVSSDNAQTQSGCFLYSQGHIILDDDANITSFTAGPQTVKVSYTYGNAKATQDIRYLCVLIVANMLKQNAVYEQIIQTEIKRNKRKVRISV